MNLEQGTDARATFLYAGLRSAQHVHSPAEPWSCERETSFVSAIHIEDTAMEQAVKVGSIPANIQFPDNLRGRIRFEESHHRLIFRGFMCKSDYDQLMRLSQDANYQNAVSHLFQISTVSDSPQMRRLGRVLATLTVACLLLAAMTWWSLLRNSPIEDYRTSPPTSDAGRVQTEQNGQDLHKQP